MATKLKQPITIKITHIANAVRARMILDGELSDCSHDNYEAVSEECADGEMCHQIDAQLKAQRIDWNTWLPLEAFQIAGYEPTFHADGSVQVGCKSIPAKTVDEFIKRRRQARRKDRTSRKK